MAGQVTEVLDPVCGEQASEQKLFADRSRHRQHQRNRGSSAHFSPATHQAQDEDSGVPIQQLEGAWQAVQ